MKKSQSLYLSLLLLSTLSIVLSASKPQKNLQESRILTSKRTPISYGESVTVTYGSTDAVIFYPGDYMVDSNGAYFVLESNCNLVLYNNGTPTWTSDSAQKKRNPKCTAVFQSDGNFVVYSNRCTPKALWASGTSTTFQTATLQLVNGQIQIVQRFADNYTVTIDVSNPSAHVTPPPHLISDTGSINVSSSDAQDFIMQEQDYLGDIDGTYAILQGDCNFVLYRQSQPLWATGTQRAEVYSCELALRRDGNIVIYAKEDPNVVFWSSESTTREDEANPVVISQLTVSDGIMKLTHILSDGPINTYDTSGWGSLNLEWPDSEEFEIFPDQECDGCVIP